MLPTVANSFPLVGCTRGVGVFLLIPGVSREVMAASCSLLVAWKCELGSMFGYSIA